jgi:hypothetical protein
MTKVQWGILTMLVGEVLAYFGDASVIRDAGHVLIGIGLGTLASSPDE